MIEQRTHSTVEVCRGIKVELMELALAFMFVVSVSISISKVPCLAHCTLAGNVIGKLHLLKS